MSVGWVSIHRSITDHPFWGCEKFTKAQAWMDLIINANHKDNKVLIKNTFIEVKRGSQIRSMVTLSELWRWDRKTVKKFLVLLESEGMILTKSTQQTTHITICNYCKYQDKDKISGQQLPQQLGQHLPQQSPSNFPTNNNVNNDNNVNKKEISFDDFYKKYPIKKSKEQAKKKWKSLSEEKKKLAIDGIEKYKSTVSVGISFVHPSTYLNQERWTDEGTTEKPSNQQAANQPISAARFKRI